MDLGWYCGELTIRDLEWFYIRPLDTETLSNVLHERLEKYKTRIVQLVCITMLLWLISLLTGLISFGLLSTGFLVGYIMYYLYLKNSYVKDIGFIRVRVLRKNSKPFQGGIQFNPSGRDELSLPYMWHIEVLDESSEYISKLSVNSEQYNKISVNDVIEFIVVGRNSRFRWYDKNV